MSPTFSTDGAVDFHRPFSLAQCLHDGRVGRSIPVRLRKQRERLQLVIVFVASIQDGVSPTFTLGLACGLLVTAGAGGKGVKISL